MSAPDPAGPPKSFGNMSDQHWSRARSGTNREALEYYRERSRAPGVAAGGGARNMYCMRCDGVVPLGPDPAMAAPAACPHCGAAIEGDARRYFNWVEIDRPPRSDARALLRIAGLALAALAALAAIVWLVARGAA